MAIKTPYELDGILQAKQVTYPQKWEEKHTPSVLVDYETDLEQYDRKLCPTLEEFIFTMIHRNLQEACKVLHLSSILEHYDEVVFENKEQFLQDILNLEIEARQSKKYQL